MSFILGTKHKVAKKHILVLSGKGGVGKSFVAVNLALALRDLGYKVGILDVDVHGPNVPVLLGATEGAIYADEHGRLKPVEVDGIKVMSVRYLLEQGVPLIRRGPLKTKLIEDMVKKTAWGDLDYLVIDSPPGTGDELLTTINAVHVDEGVIVSTPQRVAIADVTRAVGALRRLDIKPAGVVLNMSYLICPHCGHRISLATIDKEELMRELRKAIVYNELEKRIVDERMKGVKVSAKDPKDAQEELARIRREVRKEAEEIARELSEIAAEGDIDKVMEELKKRTGITIDLSRLKSFGILAELPLDLETLRAVDSGKPMRVNERIRKIFLELAKRLA